MGGKRWAPEEDRVIRDGYGRRPTAELAPLLPRRTIGAIRQRAVSLGPAKTYRLGSDAEFRRQVLALHDQGHSTMGIARRLGSWPSTVRPVLAAAGRRAHGKASAEFRGKLRDLMNARVATGAKLPCHARWHDQSPALRYGLPPMGETRLRIVLALASGPKTRRQVAESLGLPWRDSRKMFKSHSNGSHFGDLIRAGLVASSRRYSGRGKGNWQALYTLTPHCLELLSKGGTR